MMKEFILQNLKFIQWFYLFLDRNETLSNMFAGSITGLTSVLLAAVIAKRWVLSPIFDVETRVDDTGTKTLIVVTSKRFAFEANQVNFFLAVKKNVWDQGLEFQIKEGSSGWQDVAFDVQYKNIKGVPYATLPMLVTQQLHPNSPTIFLLMKTPTETTEAYYAFRTKMGDFPKGFSAKTVEKGRLPKIIIKPLASE